MTKKDYILIAEAIKDNLEGWRGWTLSNGKTTADSSIITLELVDRLADRLWKQNDRFDYTRFKTACGFEE